MYRVWSETLVSKSYLEGYILSYPENIKQGVLIELNGYKVVVSNKSGVMIGDKVYAYNYKGLIRYNYNYYPAYKIERNSFSMAIGFVDKVRQHVITSMPTCTNCALIRSVFIGDSSLLTKSDYEAFKEAGLLHLFAASGYNITLFSSVIYLFTKNLKKMHGFSLILTPIVLGFLFGYQPSVMRTVLLFVIAGFYYVCNKSYNILYSIVLSYLMILILFPYSYLSLGLYLSYLGLLSIIVALRVKKTIYRLSVFPIINFLFTFPLISHAFNIINLNSIISGYITYGFVSVILILTLVSLVVREVTGILSFILFIYIIVIKLIAENSLLDIQYYIPMKYVIAWYSVLILIAAHFINNEKARANVSTS